MAVGGRNPGTFPIPNNILDANATRRDHDSHALPIARFTARAGEWRGISTKAYGKQRISHLDDPQLLDPHSSTETRTESTKLGEMQFLFMLDLVVCAMLFETKSPFLILAFFPNRRAVHRALTRGLRVKGRVAEKTVGGRNPVRFPIGP